MVTQFIFETPNSYDVDVSPVDQDGLWKKVIADLFEDFLLFFLPEFHEEVDFSKPVEFVQQELFKEIMKDRKGRKMADQIAKVQLKNGKEQWILVHIEIQSEDDEDFPRRMFEYFYRIYDRYHKKIVAIVLFTDRSTKSTNNFNYKYFGTELSYTFNKFIVSNFDEEELKNSKKLFSKALLAAMYMNQTKGKKWSMRSAYKRALLRDVVTLQNASRTEISALLYFIDYLLKLPKELSDQLTRELRSEIQKEEKEMLHANKDELPPTITGMLELERKEGIEKGIEQGIEQGIRQTIQKLIKSGFSDEVIANALERSIEEIQAIRKECK